MSLQEQREQIRQRRLALGMSLEDVVFRVRTAGHKISIGTIYSLESSTSDVGMSHLDAVLSALDEAEKELK